MLDVKSSAEHDDATHCVPSAMLVQEDVAFATSHNWHALAGFVWPTPTHTPSIRQFPATSELPHPVAALHASVVHAYPSSQFRLPPPPVHSPPTHDCADVKTLPAQFPDPHTVPSSTSVQARASTTGAHTWHAFPMLASPATKHVPPIRQFPACTRLLHPVAGTHASVVHAFESSHETGVPAAPHQPDSHVRRGVHCSPAHPLATHSVPSTASFQAPGLPTASQVWQGFSGFLAWSA